MTKITDRQEIERQGIKRQGIVYLIGAGPGDPGLITVKGLACLQTADVVVYDRLAGARLLGHCRPDARLIYVGKQPDRHTLTQNEINRLLVQEAAAGHTVARLKGGDPFVFGRGGEEAEELAQHGIPFEVVPGITSAIAVPAYAGIPVTHRNHTATLAIITGNEDPEKEDSNIQWSKIATGAGTLVFLMGMGNLAGISNNLMAHGRDPQTPVALIRWGTRPEQQTLTGELANIAALAQEANFKNPAIIIVGEVVKLRERLHWFEDKPLFGKRILVTRSREQASALSRSIEQLGGEPVEFPTISINEPFDYAPLDRAIGRLAEYQWVIFTSVNGVNYFFHRLRHLGGDIRELHGAGICAIGPQTREFLERLALRVDYVPGEYRAEEIVSGLRGLIKPGDLVLLPRADIARQALPEGLAALGARVDEVTAYRTTTGQGNAKLITDMLADGEIDIITFTSSSTVRNFVSLLGAEQIPALTGRALVACIGPITAQTATELGLPVHIQPQAYTIDGLLQAILSYLQQGELT
ncbi:MAG: uroporphyrinogen-III C-methyltransferase [Firmicutes bacterium]|nr:uroporphyrinogen-III C-methyltransferase [Bacillota bacterium]